MTRQITWEEARDFYDKLGPREDLESRFQDRVFDVLVGASAFERAQSVFELGCGTGRFARRLFEQSLPAHARYVGVDVSGRMVELAGSKLEPWKDRTQVHQTHGELAFDHPPGSFDRFVATYVLDLLPEASIAAALAEAHRLLKPDGLLCTIDLTFGEAGLSSAVAKTWDYISGKFPAHLGGCRPIRLRDFLADDAWEVVHGETVTVLAVPSDVLVARRIP
jgi:ubiquinone/menaquinone biosynthesis C-methylase UbiE